MVSLPFRMSDAVRHLSRRARVALALGALAAVLVGAAALWLRPTATLMVLCRHDFRRADIRVALDGDVVLADTMTGSVSRRWFGVVEKTAGSYSRTLAVPPGESTVEVRLRAPGYDRTRKIQADFRRGVQSVLSVDSGRDLALAWRAAPPGGSATADAAVAATEPPSNWARHAGSILFTILGSIVSASIGVFVQDYLRARKARKAELANAAAASTQPAQSLPARHGHP